MSLEGGTTRAQREAAQRASNFAAAKQHTNDLRHSEEPRWKRLREHVEKEGIALDHAAIASKNTEDNSLEFGLLVARDGRAFSFEFDWLRDEEGRALTYEDAQVSAWEELNEHWRETYERDLTIGRQVLEDI